MRKRGKLKRLPLFSWVVLLFRASSLSPLAAVFGSGDFLYLAYRIAAERRVIAAWLEKKTI
jgi:hypothetical protein